MVAGAAYSYISGIWLADIPHQRIGFSPLYLYLILMKHEKSLETIIVLALAFLVLALWRHIPVLFYVSAGLLVLPLISKKATNLIGQAWMGFSQVLGAVMNHILLFLMYYLVLFPLSLLQKLSGKNQILKKSDGDSYFHKRNHTYSAKDVDHPW